MSTCLALDAPKESIQVATQDADQETLEQGTEKRPDVVTISFLNGLAPPDGLEHTKKFWWQRIPKRDPSAVGTQVCCKSMER